MARARRKNYAATTIEHLKGTAERMVELGPEVTGRKKPGRELPVQVIDGTWYRTPISALAYGVLMVLTGGEEYERWLASVTAWIDSAEIKAPDGQAWSLGWTATGVLMAYPPEHETPELR